MTKALTMKHVRLLGKSKCIYQVGRIPVLISATLHIGYDCGRCLRHKCTKLKLPTLCQTLLHAAGLGGLLMQLPITMQVCPYRVWCPQCGSRPMMQTGSATLESMQVAMPHVFQKKLLVSDPGAVMTTVGPAL